MEPKYQIGDIAQVKDVETLKHEFGDPIKVSCGWLDAMNKYAGKNLTVKCVKYFSGRMSAPHYSYQFVNGGGWWFSEDTFVEQEVETYQEPVMSFEQAMLIGKERIV